MIKLIKSTQLKFVGSGGFGVYSQIKRTKFGVKVCRRDYFFSQSDAATSSTYRAVESEFKRLQDLNKITRLVPKAYSMVIIDEECPISKQTYFYVGYMMEHIVGIPVGRVKMTREDELRLDRSEALLVSKGITRVDGHGFNVIKTKGRRSKFIFIDAGGLRGKNHEHQCGWE